MSSRDLHQVEVILDIDSLGQRRMGLLHRQTARSGDVYSFEFDGDWLKRHDPIALDPDLLPAPGRTYPSAGRSQFGIFMDSAPDRWGRTLMQRREALLATQEKRPVRTLLEWDYLLGVHDFSRLGALRFRADAQSPFLDDTSANTAPPLASLRELQAAARVIEEDRRADDASLRTALNQLLAPGSSLGGARPKASVIDEQGHLCIAKFPSGQDEWDVGGWEAVAYALARHAGIRVPATRALRFTPDGHTFIAQRFDRTPTGGRLAFVSAMTLLQRTDGDADVSYLELVDLLQSRGAQTQVDCEELFRRVVFSLCIANTDDHLRNHGFIVGTTGLTLSPVFDINPNPQRRQLTLAIDETNATLSLDVAESASEYYGLTLQHGREIIAAVRKAVKRWPREAKALGIPERQQEQLRPAFALADA
ncbi:MAG TPA: type II toxin-antitoxin system HipA family toxin [Povalibacter sp.]|uniref:type II toxin-antitoxin system HipA family toxin n=1 Tax=Povalibacter sp. TaxID=1962978 RepID=UPI002C9D898A|nr:type II toxin-antitoxin system HipA family toxin [Povalibacter sp.]HMN47012.1 type II toxin-antitoxin system HipA family toxin [Povalibacter sp.]